MRTEAAFWFLALAAWFLWRPLVLKILVAVFTVIHLAIGAAGEFRANGKNDSAFTASPTMKRAIVAFDLVEAIFLPALGVVAISYLTHAG